MSSPIGVFAHKRPAHLQACLEAISQSEVLLGRELPIYIFCDAPKNQEQEAQVKETVDVALKFGKANVVARDKNYGFRNITEGISQLCDQHGRAIIIEDDCLIAPDFLPFMCNALEKYEDDPRVFMASGFMYYGSQPKAPETFFLNTSFIWGWATWKRAWDHFIWDSPGWEGFIQDKRKRYLYDCFGSQPFSKGLLKTMTGVWKAWGPRWMYAAAKAGGLTLYPHKSMVWNCGCGGGTHGNSKLDFNPSQGEREVYIHGDMEREDFLKPRLRASVYLGKDFPSKVKVDRRALRSLAITFFEERLRTETRKRWRLWLKLFLQKCALPFTRRP